MTTLSMLIRSSTPVQKEKGCILCLGASLEGWFLSMLAASLFLSSLLV